MNLKLIEMNFRKLCLATVILGFLFTGCTSDDDNNGGELIIDYGGSAHYFINNKSDTDLNLILITSEQLGKQIDSSKRVMANSKLKVLTDGEIGINPAPEDSFSRLEFYGSTNDSAIFTIDPIINEDWEITEQDLGDSGLGLTTYEYTITNKALN